MRRFLRVTQESAYATYNGANSSLYPRLSSQGSTGVQEQPDFWTVQDGSGLNVQALSGSATMRVAGNLITELSPSTAQFWLSWAAQRINSTQTSPWTTTEVPNDLASCTVDYARTNFDQTVRRKRYLGEKVTTLSLAGSKDAPKIMMNMGLAGGTVQGNHFDSSSDPSPATFPEPALSTFPTDIYTFQMLSGNVTLLGVARTNFDSWTFNINNQLRQYYDESPFANAIRLAGQTTSMTFNMRLKGSPDDWLSYSGAIKGECFAMLNAGTHSIKFDLVGQAYITQLTETDPIGEEHYYSITIAAQLDTTVGNILVLTFT